MILGFSDYEAQGRRLAEQLERTFQPIDIHRFPDGESKVTVPAELPERVILCRSLDRPNDKLIELMLAARTARANGAGHLTLVAPYLCYMRQDIAFSPGEAVSQRIVGQFLAELFDAVITVDPHLHRIERLEQAIPTGAAISLSAAPALSAFLAENEADPLLLGPDEEARQWVRAVAEPAGLEYAVAHKERRGDRDVRVVLPKHDFAGRTVVLVDDMISTGRTLITVARALKETGVGSIRCLVTHPLFADDATRHLQEAGVQKLWSSDSITHPSNAVVLDQTLAEAIRRLE
ncbi:ribose-phosphate diphosphokinase [Thiohalomonas denitrificans]|uniref:ribose-phosphate diphosphokinase n=1 Tax=Thiohalomonas denitrificans TaxID=415747 RepID=UPI0026EDCE8D|nr:ribose-phosphate diphosphokinase [Thiohalomonas denitrificans]